MSKKSSYLLGIFLTIIIGCLLQFFLCCKNCKDTCQEKKNKETTVVIPEKTIVKPATKNSFNISDNSSGLAFTADDNFNFLKDNYNFKDSISSSMNSQIDKLSIYLNDNKKKHLNIVGLYNSTETNNSIFPNLGYARANKIKNYFISKGMSSKYMNVSGKLDDDFIPNINTNIFYGPVNFSVTTLKENSNRTEQIKKLKDSLTLDPLILYFKTGANSLTLSKEQRQKVADLLTYVEKSENGKLIVTGHTDNTGLRANNIGLAFKRADFVKDILIKNGISESYINTASKGPDQPIADNNTEEGKAKNRRVTVTIN
jgi:OOP family OmpA-OmpF porin